MQLQWIKCQGDVWCRLNTVNLQHAHFDNLSGVYVIWHGGNDPHTVRVGQGVIRDRLAAHRTDPAIQEFADSGLFVTWASVQSASQDAVEAYLFHRLSPKVVERSPDAQPIEVNIPW